MADYKDIGKIIDNNAFLIKTNTVKHKNGSKVLLYGLSYKITDTTIREILIPDYNLLHLNL